MTLLLDTQMLVWIAREPERLPSAARTLIEDVNNPIFFSVASIWEIAIKHALGRADFNLDPHRLRVNLQAQDFTELPIAGEHAAAVTDLPSIPKDPFDRLLVAQAVVEGLTLLTTDAQLACYPGPILRV